MLNNLSGSFGGWRLTYSRINKPVFYTDHVNWTKIHGRAKSDTISSESGSFNTGYDEFDLFDLQPQNLASWDSNGSSTHLVIAIDLGASVTCDSFAILNHNLTSASGEIRIAHHTSAITGAGQGTTVTGLSYKLNSEAGISSVATITNGESLFTFTAQTKRYWAVEIEDTVAIGNFGADVTIGAVLLGEQYSLPHSPDMNVAQSFGMSGVSISESGGGKRFADSRWIKGNSSGGSGTNYIPFRTSTVGFAQMIGRQAFTLSYSYVSDTNILPSDLSSVGGDNFALDVFIKTGGKTLPFVFGVDSASTTEGDYMFARLMSDLSISQLAYTVHNIGFTIEQEF